MFDQQPPPPPLMSISQNTPTDHIVKTEMDQGYLEQLKNNPQPVPPPQTDTVISDQVNKNGKRPFKKSMNPRPKKQKVVKQPVYVDGCQPAMILNEYYRNLKFNFEVQPSVSNKPNFVCTVDIEVKDPTNEQVKINSFRGEGVSKKDAKKECCNQALSGLFPESYHAPQRLTLCEAEKEEFIDQRTKNLKRLADLRRRIAKIVTAQSVVVKAPAQILHELSTKIAETGKCIQENGLFLDKKFGFQIDNVKDESLASLDVNNPSSINAFGFGRNKKDAKNQASRNALKQFFDCDLDKFSNMTQLNQSQTQQQQQQL